HPRISLTEPLRVTGLPIRAEGSRVAVRDADRLRAPIDVAGVADVPISAAALAPVELAVREAEVVARGAVLQEDTAAPPRLAAEAAVAGPAAVATAPIRVGALRNALRA